MIEKSMQVQLPSGLAGTHSRLRTFHKQPTELFGGYGLGLGLDLERSETLDNILVGILGSIVSHADLLGGHIDLDVLDTLAQRGNIVHDFLCAMVAVDVGNEDRRHGFLLGRGPS